MTLARLSDESIAFEGGGSLPKSPIGKILRKDSRKQAHTPS